MPPTTSRPSSDPNHPINIMLQAARVLQDRTAAAHEREAAARLLRDCATGAIAFYVKGADTVMLKLLKGGQEKQVEATEKILAAV